MFDDRQNFSSLQRAGEGEESKLILTTDKKKKLKSALDVIRNVSEDCVELRKTNRKSFSKMLEIF